MKNVLVVLAALLPAVAYSIGEARDTDWPHGPGFTSQETNLEIPK